MRVPHHGTMRQARKHAKYGSLSMNTHRFRSSSISISITHPSLLRDPIDATVLSRRIRGRGVKSDGQAEQRAYHTVGAPPPPPHCRRLSISTFAFLPCSAVAPHAPRASGGRPRTCAELGMVARVASRASCAWTVHVSVVYIKGDGLCICGLEEFKEVVWQ